jgi:mRNA interferase MazF
MEYFKDFENWNILKKKIDKNKNNCPDFSEGQVWWIYAGINIGYEIDGKGNLFLRPVLIIRRYNSFMFLGVYLSTKIKDVWYHQPISVRNKISAAVISQLKTFSYERLHHKIFEISEDELEEVKKKIIDSIKNNPSR